MDPDLTHKAAQALADLPIHGHTIGVDDLITIWIDGYATGHHDGMDLMSDKAIEILKDELDRTDHQEDQ